MSFVLLEFACPCHGIFESLVDRNGELDVAPCQVIVPAGEEEDGEDVVCGLESSRIVSAAKLKTVVYGAAAERGPSGPPPPHVMDTRPIAEGMPQHEFIAMRRAARREARLMKLPKNVRRIVEKQGG